MRSFFHNYKQITLQHSFLCLTNRWSFTRNHQRASEVLIYKESPKKMLLPIFATRRVALICFFLIPTESAIFFFVFLFVCLLVCWLVCYHKWKNLNFPSFEILRGNLFLFFFLSLRNRPIFLCVSVCLFVCWFVITNETCVICSFFENFLSRKKNYKSHGNFPLWFVVFWKTL